MAHHRRGKPKQQRSGCLSCKPHKGNGQTEEVASVDRRIDSLEPDDWKQQKSSKGKARPKKHKHQYGPWGRVSHGVSPWSFHYERHCTFPGCDHDEQVWGYELGWPYRKDLTEEIKATLAATKCLEHFWGPWEDTQTNGYWKPYSKKRRFCLACGEIDRRD